MLQANFSSIFVTQIKIIRVINHLKIYKVTFLKSKSITLRFRKYSSVRMEYSYIV